MLFQESSSTLSTHHSETVANPALPSLTMPLPYPLPDIDSTLYGKTNLERLFHQLANEQGLFSRSTLHSFYSTLVRLVCDHRMQGCVLTLSRPEACINQLSLPLETCPHVTVINLETFATFQPALQLGGTPLLNSGFGCAVFLMNELSLALYWNSDSTQTYKLDQGGWTFQPTNVRFLADKLAEASQEESVKEYVLMAPCDAQFDEKLSKLVFSMINNLEHRNRDLAHALVREQLLNKQMAEQERLAAIGQMSSVLAHEIRNPLGVIDLYANLVETQLAQLEEATLEPLIFSNLGQIRSAVQHLDSVLTELTQYSRPLHIEPTLADIEQLLQETVAFYKPSFEQKGVALHLSVNLSLPASVSRPLQLMLDSTKIKQALINLMKNALEATPSGKKVVVELSCRRGDQYVYVKVRDEGKGVPETYQKKLFTPFFTTKGANGTGLGLAHVRKILQAHGGQAELLWSEAEKGASFALLFPLLTASAS